MGGILSTLAMGIPLSTTSSTQNKVTTKNLDQDIDQVFAPVSPTGGGHLSNSGADSHRGHSSLLREFKIHASDVSYMFGSARRFTLYREAECGALHRLMEARFKSMRTRYFMNAGEYQLYQYLDSEKKCLVGRVVSTGWTSNQMNIEDAWGNNHGAVRFNFNGSLMRFNCSLPKLADLDRVRLARAISETSGVLYDLGHLIAGFLTPAQTWATRKVGPRRPWLFDDISYSPHFTTAAESNADASQLCYKVYQN